MKRILSNIQIEGSNLYYFTYLNNKVVDLIFFQIV